MVDSRPMCSRPIPVRYLTRSLLTLSRPVHVRYLTFSEGVQVYIISSPEPKAHNVNL